MNWTKINDREYVSGEWRIKLRQEDTSFFSPEPHYEWLWTVYKPGDDPNGEGFDCFDTPEEAMRSVAILCKGRDQQAHENGINSRGTKVKTQTPVQQLTKRIRTICRKHYMQGMTERRLGYAVAVWDRILADEIKSALNTIVAECGAGELPPGLPDFVEMVEAVTRERLEAAEEGDTEAAEEEPDQHMKPKRGQ